ncbi:hypothetical protein [Pelagicoccus mobilis]|uniref:Caspase family protein n=1 Tax=Pelagicoccus mobilis TaxID=415221 RepID=A0A934RV66_9BACT|nr:hypothetical protein [Pelagicoccus mobilis]MBK1877046.1 hypothetical protein [Pelagicoccus mobilis]
MIRLTTAFITVQLLLQIAFSQDRLLVIQGAAGEETFEEQFSKAASLWMNLAEETVVPATHIHPGSDQVLMSDRIHEWITSEQTLSSEEIWIVYIGHGTSNDSGAKLNLQGPDVSSNEFARWLAPFEGDLVFIHGGSASAPFMPQLASPGRTLITATRSGAEVNYARFGELFAVAISSPESDLDLDGEISLLEAFIAASTSVDTFYEEAGRLASEHALIDDNGDGKGYQYSSFDGLRPKSDVQDGRRASRIFFRGTYSGSQLSQRQLSDRNRLETELDELYSKKKDLSEVEYFQQLEEILDQLASLYRQPNDS